MRGDTHSICRPRRRPVAARARGSVPAGGSRGGMCVCVCVAVRPRETGIKDTAHARLLKLALHPGAWGQAPAPAPARWSRDRAVQRQEWAGQDGGLVGRKLRGWDCGWVGSACQGEGCPADDPRRKQATENCTVVQNAQNSPGKRWGLRHRPGLDLLEASCKQSQEWHGAAEGSPQDRARLDLCFRTLRMPRVAERTRETRRTARLKPFSRLEDSEWWPGLAG